MRCPNCNSENVQFVDNRTKRGFSFSDACCGYILLGPLGILCGALGSGIKDSDEYWICNNCGGKFSILEMKWHNRKSNNNAVSNSNVLTPPQQPEAPALPPQPETPAPPPQQLQIEEKSEPEPPARLSDPKMTFERNKTYSGELGTEALLKRAFLFLEDKDWEKAYEYGKNALDTDAGCAEAYLAVFMAEYNISLEENISESCAEMTEEIDSLFELENYRKANRFGDDEFKQKLKEYSDKAVYIFADKRSAEADTYESYLDTAKIFDRIPEYSDAAQRAEQCREKAEQYHADQMLSAYNAADELLKKAATEDEILSAKSKFEELGDYGDSAEKAAECDRVHERILADKISYLLNGHSYTFVCKTYISSYLFYC